MEDEVGASVVNIVVGFSVVRSVVDTSTSGRVVCVSEVLVFGALVVVDAEIPFGEYVVGTVPSSFSVFLVSALVALRSFDSCSSVVVTSEKFEGTLVEEGLAVVPSTLLVVSF